MDDDSWRILSDKIKNILSTKRLRITLYITAVLWVAVATQIAVNKAFQEELQITEAFIKSDTEEMQSSLEIVAEYNTDVLSESDKKDLIYKLADTIGLTIDSDITVWQENSRSEYYYFKQAKQAATEIKVVSVEQQIADAIKIKNYIIVRLSILKGIQSIDGYKKTLEATLDKMEVVNKQITLKYEGNREGDLTSKQKHEIAALLVDELQGEIALEYDEGDLYTVYAYTGMLKEYVTSMGNKINVQIAITYNELTNKTRITLATPVLVEDY
jgi:hypothetical protein